MDEEKPIHDDKTRKHSKISLGNLWQWVIAFGALLAILSMVYYQVIYLPAKLSSCLGAADYNAAGLWDSTCKANGRGEDCSLPTSTANRIDQSRQQNKDNCFKQYSK